MEFRDFFSFPIVYYGNICPLYSQRPEFHFVRKSPVGIQRFIEITRFAYIIVS